MLFGIPPFYEENTSRMYELICYDDVSFPRSKQISEECEDLIKGLLNKNPISRLGADKGLFELKTHPFFSSINFEALFGKKIKAPYIPDQIGKFDTKYVDDEFTSEILNDSAVDPADIEVIKSNNDLFNEI